MKIINILKSSFYFSIIYINSPSVFSYTLHEDSNSKVDINIEAMAGVFSSKENYSTLGFVRKVIFANVTHAHPA